MAWLQFSDHCIAVVSNSVVQICCKTQRDDGENSFEKKLLSFPATEEDTKPNHEKCPEVQSQEQKRDPHQPTGQILCSRFSFSGRLFACCDDKKCLRLWETEPTWRLLSERTVQKRCTAINFNHKEDEIFISDKFGDVYRFSARDPAVEGDIILGHLSIVLDLVVSDDDKFILTCERDEKIRVSCLPNAYNIHCYCLGHTEFVSRCCLVPGFTHVLMSAGGDSTLRVWNYNKGKELDSIQINHESERKKKDEYFTVTSLTCSRKDGFAAISLLRENVVPIYTISKDGKGICIVEVTKLDFTEQVLNVAFDPEDRLWVVQASPTDTVQVFQVTGDNGCNKVSRLAVLPEKWINSALQSMNADYDFFKASLNIERPQDCAHKKTYDNLKDYMSRKEQRIAEETVRKDRYEEMIAQREQNKRQRLEQNTEKKS